MGGKMIDNSFFFRFDRSSFKSFYVAANELNFTKAAIRSGITQSGISQHIAKLETELNTTLFLRSKGGLKITETGKLLKDYLETIYQKEESLLEALSVSTNSLTGVVSYAMPESCLMSPHFSMMLSVKKKEFPKIELKVEMHDSESVVQKVLNGDVDFGFITQEITHSNINNINFCNEDYVLLTSTQITKSDIKLENLNFVGHPDFQSLFDVWFQAQYPRKKVINLKRLNFTGNTNRIAATLAMVSGGLGVTILPEHCAIDLIKKKQIKLLKNYKPAIGVIHIIHRKDVTLPKRVKKVINTFLSFYHSNI